MGYLGRYQWECGYVLLVEPFNVRWIGPILLNKAHYGS
jgi:hypothetical protein